MVRELARWWLSAPSPSFSSPEGPLNQVPQAPTLPLMPTTVLSGGGGVWAVRVCTGLHSDTKRGEGAPPACGRGEGGTYHADELHLSLPVPMSAFPLQVTLPHLGGHMSPDTPTLYFCRDAARATGPQGEAPATPKEKPG